MKLLKRKFKVKKSQLEIIIKKHLTINISFYIFKKNFIQKIYQIKNTIS